MPAINLFPAKIDIAAVTVVTTSTGNTKALTTLYSNVPALIRTSSPSFLIYDDGRKVQITHAIATPTVLNVSPGNVVLYGSRTFKVQYAMNLMEQDRCFVLMCYEYIDQVG